MMLSAERERWTRYVRDNPVSTLADVACCLLSDLRADVPDSWDAYTHALMLRGLFDKEVSGFVSRLLNDKRC